MFYKNLDYFTLNFILTSDSQLGIFYALVYNPRYFLCCILYLKCRTPSLT